MQSIVKALQRVLRQHEPLPAVVMDRYWNVVMTNDVSPKFFNKFVDMKSRPSPRLRQRQAHAQLFFSHHHGRNPAK